MVTTSMTAPPPEELADSQQRRRFLVAATGAAAGAITAAAAYPFLASMAPSARARAEGAPVDVDVGGIAAGELKVVAWRGRPVWLLRRTAAMLAGLGGHDRLLADPASQEPQQPPYCRNRDRSIRPDLFVAVGVCTHLGCSPKLRVGEDTADLGADWPGGFFCPCHGSKFDLAGRVFKNVPAPTNLVIPSYRYLTDTHLTIGEDPTA
jgi:ubiquinol-cytochrome c reductase iron-sulfur subunit